MTRRFPGVADAEALVRAGQVLVDGFPVRNPASLVRRDTSIALAPPRVLVGERKLGVALEAFGVSARGRVALDVGASTGGFTRRLLDAGARRVYAVDAGHGQLLGSLRQDDRVVNLEATNLGELTRTLVPEPVGIVTIDVSYLPLSRAVPQLAMIDIGSGADLVALVKPQFELGLPEPPTDRPTLDDAVARAAAGIRVAGWRVLAAAESPIRGARGAIEFFVHARKEES